MIWLCFSRTWLPLPPNFCSQATRKYWFFHENNILVSLDFTRSECWTSFNFSLEDSLVCLEIIMVLIISYCTILLLMLFFVFLQRLLVVLEESLYIHNIRDMKVQVYVYITIVKSKHIMLCYCNKLTHVSGHLKITSMLLKT